MDNNKVRALPMRTALRHPLLLSSSGRVGVQFSACSMPDPSRPPTTPAPPAALGCTSWAVGEAGAAGMGAAPEWRR